MSGKTQLVGGPFEDFAGNPIAGGTLVLQLSQDAQLTLGQGQLGGGRTVTLLLDSDGNVSTSPPQYVWPTDQMAPTGVTYRGQVFTAQGQLVWGPTYSLTIPTGATFNVDNWTPPFIGQIPTNNELTLATNGVDNVDQNLLDLVAGSGISLSNSDGNTTITATGVAFTWYNVKTYGAVGNGSTNDTAAIQAAIDAAVAADGGVIYFPPGTYEIQPASSPTDHIFNMGTTPPLNLWFRGDGIGTSTIQVAASAGDYKVIFGPSANSGASNVTFSDLTIDQNTANNPVASNITTYPRMVIWTNTGDADLTVVNCEFLNLGSINCIVSYNARTTIIGNRFTVAGLGSVYFDHSTLYIPGEHSVISNNIFVGVVNGAGSVCAIETHGGRQTVTGNTIDAYWVGMNITGVTSLDSNTIAVTGNTIMSTYYGIQLWSYQNGGHTTGFGLHGVTVSDNSIRLTQTAWTTNPGAGGANLGNPCGIFLNPDNNLPTKNILISDNVVEYDLEPDDTYPWNSAGFGIGYWDATEVSSVDGFRVIDNTIVNCPLPAVRVHVDGQNVEVSGNMIVNPGSSLNASVTSGFQTGIFLANYNNPTLNVRVNNNTIVDNNSTTRMVYGLLIENQADSDVVALGNVINCTGATTSAFTSFATVTSGINPVIQFTQINPAVNGTNIPTNVGQCSIAYDPTTGKTYAVSPNGINWTAVTYGTAAPSGALFASAGDTVWNTTPTSGGFAGWKCISSGTPGTWCPIPLFDVAGDLVLDGQPNGQYIAYKHSGVNRWVALVSNNETGSNAGSDLFINNYADDGTQLGVAMEVVRQTGEVLVNHGLQVGGTAPSAAAGTIALGGTTSATASSGAATLPGNPLGFLVANVAGVAVKIPYYAT